MGQFLFCSYTNKACLLPLALNFKLSSELATKTKREVGFPTALIIYLRLGKSDFKPRKLCVPAEFQSMPRCVPHRWPAKTGIFPVVHAQMVGVAVALDTGICAETQAQSETCARSIGLVSVTAGFVGAGRNAAPRLLD